MTTDQSPPASLAEIRALRESLPTHDADARAAAEHRNSILTKPAGALADLEDIAIFMAGWQGRAMPEVNHPRTAVFAGNHGVAAQGVSAFPAEVTAQMVQNFQAGGAAVNQLVEALDGDLIVYEMALNSPTADFTQGPAMSDEDCARALAYGMMAVEPGVDLLMLGEMGIANTTSAAAIYHALFGGKAEDWTGPGTGVEGLALENKVRIVREGVALHAGNASDGLDVLARLGGKEIAAIAGAILAARMARVPVILDGYICCAAAACLHAWAPESIDHCLAGHLSAEGAHSDVLRRLGKKPILQLGMRLGEGSGATLAAQIVRSACAMHTGMATFEDAGVSESVH
ncbi:MAG: nicotinate-nucleotide--dimethylbenzimidazole phosphoribosyltransferase [Kiloniella sp.]|nr:nicotinate-nucleotide--dimethylbenzimidazole phosphoribosyltransferase [Kiloniella sp.]